MDICITENTCVRSNSVAIKSEIKSIKIDSVRIAEIVFITEEYTVVNDVDIFIEEVDSESIETNAIIVFIFNLNIFFIYNSIDMSDSAAR